MNIGDILWLTPTMESASGVGTRGPLPCRVVYIHPERRYFTVEFETKSTGERWRESMMMPAQYRERTIGG